MSKNCLTYIFKYSYDLNYLDVNVYNTLNYEHSM